MLIDVSWETVFIFTVLERFVYFFKLCKQYLQIQNNKSTGNNNCRAIALRQLYYCVSPLQILGTTSSSIRRVIFILNRFSEDRFSIRITVKRKPLLVILRKLRTVTLISEPWSNINEFPFKFIEPNGHLYRLTSQVTRVVDFYYGWLPRTNFSESSEWMSYITWMELSWAKTNVPLVIYHNWQNRTSQKAGFSYSIALKLTNDSRHVLSRVFVLV